MGGEEQDDEGLKIITYYGLRTAAKISAVLITAFGECVKNETDPQFSIRNSYIEMLDRSIKSFKEVKEDVLSSSVTKDHDVH